MAIEEEPASPSSRLMHQPVFNLCIFAILGFKTVIDLPLFKCCMSQTLLKHPRFSSLLVKKGKRGRLSWKRVEVDIDCHVFAPELDPDMDHPDTFIEDFIAGLSRIPMDWRKPLWEAYVLNIRSSNANSTIICKIHHSLGDGVSLISLLLACSKMLSEPHSCPTFPSRKPNHQIDKNGRVGIVWRIIKLFHMMFLIAWYTLTDFILIIATILYLKDEKTQIKGSNGIESSPKKFVHKVISLDDVKLVKNAVNATVNDVIMGMTEAGISHYLHTRSYEEEVKNGIKNEITRSGLRKNLRLRAGIAFNLRPSPAIEDLTEIMEKEKELNGMWGNIVGLGLIPIKIISPQEDPLVYIQRANGIMQKKKLSFAPKLVFIIISTIINIFGMKFAAIVTRRVFYHTTFGFSNVVGPQQDITLFGHSLSYIAPTVHGFPQALLIHYQSYGNKLVISLAADEKLIPNPHQIFLHFQKFLESAKEAVTRRGLNKLTL